MKPVHVLLVFVLALAACVYQDDEPAENYIQLKRNTEFDDAKLRLFVTLADGTVVSVNTTDDVFQALPGVTPVPNHQARALTFFKETKDDTSVAHALLSWNPDEPADYLVFGWWTQFHDQHLPELSFEGAERFAIVDGPELDHGVVPQLPDAGTVTYEGPAGGLYSYLAGSDRGEHEGSFVIDEYQGTITLTADFMDGTVRGCIGCVGDLVTQRAHFGAFLGRKLIDMQTVATDYELHLATAIIREDGMFERDRITIWHPTRTITHVEGSWGGTMSSRPDMDGNPRLAAGFNGVYYEESDGSWGEFSGSFLGLSEPFKETGRSGPLPGEGD